MANADPLLVAAKAAIDTAFRQALAQGADPDALVYFVTSGPAGAVTGTLHKVNDAAKLFAQGPGAGLGAWLSKPVPRGHVRVVTVNGSQVNPYFVPIVLPPSPGQTPN